MSGGFDPRLTLRRDGAAARRLEGIVAAARYRDPEPAVLTAASASILVGPGIGEQVDQLLFGEAFDVLDRRDGWAFGQARRDGYVGWVEEAALGPRGLAPTHRVRKLRTVALNEPNVRAAAIIALPLNALVRVEGREGCFTKAAGAGWIASEHLIRVGEFETDPVAVAERHLGTPYLWGGRSWPGIDCSGLVQQALFACGRACPRDSDQQARLGRPVDPASLRRGDLVCWPGHIGVMLDAVRLVHASSVQMAVVVEPLAEAIAARLPDPGPPTGFRRLIA